MKKGISRRNFLMITGGTGAAMMLKPADKLVHKLIPYVNPPAYPKPGIWDFYLTTCRECPAGCGMMLWHRDGRSTKAEGNPHHTVNRGKLCIRGQSSVQGQYDPDRLKKVLKKIGENFTGTSWNAAFEEIRNAIKGKKIKVISDIQTGSLAGIISDFSIKYGNNAPLYLEPFNYESLRKGNNESFGIPFIPRYNIKDCDLIISFGAGFLDTWLSPVEYANDFSEINSLKNSKKCKFIYIGPAETLTALNADLFIKTEPGTETGIAVQLIKSLSSNYNDKLPNIQLPNNEIYSKHINKVISSIRESKSPIVLAGSPLDKTIEGINTVKAANLLNHILGNGHRLDFEQYHALSKTALSEEINSFFDSIGKEDIVFVHNANPAYYNIDLVIKLSNAGVLIYLGTMLNETAGLADWVLPVNYPFEEWGDYEPWKGTISLMQPTMQPIYDTRSAGDIFLQLMQENNTHSFRDVVWDNWNKWSGESKRNTLLTNGFIKMEASPANTAYLNPAFTDINVQGNKEEYFLYASPSLFFYDGRLSNRPWLQEIANPVSNIVWQSWLDINKVTAKHKGISDGDIVNISANGKTITVPARVSENITEKTLSLETGYGHSRFGHVADNIGVNVFTLLSANRYLSKVKLEKTNNNEPILYLHPTKEQYHRNLLQEIKIKNLESENLRKEEITWPMETGYSKDKDLYEPHKHKDHRWAMVIDLQACIGCKACEAACYAENNIPVVGRYHCERGREMSWLKVVPYKISENRTAFLPLPCQHCDAAPCEPVCPVFASVHNEEGLNAQVYNRCIGTRYCSNNCPYKVRRFN